MAKQSALKARHQGNGAEFTEEDGWIVPLRFSDPVQEYYAVRSALGLLDLCHRALLRFSGPDRTSFLQGMVSNDVRKLVPGHGVHAAVLDIQGKILADTRILCTEDSFLVDLWESRKETILSHLHRYLIADEVEITDLSGQYGVVSLQGPKAPSLLERLMPKGEIPARELDHRTWPIGKAEVRFVRSTHTGEEGYDLWIGTDHLLEAVSFVHDLGKPFPLQWVGIQAQEILRIEAGLPRYGIDMDEDNLLLETGLDRAVSFDKGCYLGQEVVERIRSRGHINKKLVGMVLEGDTLPERGSTIWAGEKELGRITSSALSPAMKRPLALGYVHRDYAQPGTRVTIHGDGKTIPAEVSSLPFYRPPAPLESLQGLG